MHNQTPFEVAEDGVLSDELVALLSCHKKRKRRGTPVKQRAANAGVTLPPTPESIRAGVEDSSPGKRKQSEVLLQAPPKDLSAVGRSARDEDQRPYATQPVLQFASEGRRITLHQEEGGSRESHASNVAQWFFFVVLSAVCCVFCVSVECTRGCSLSWESGADFVFLATPVAGE